MSDEPHGPASGATPDDPLPTPPRPVAVFTHAHARHLDGLIVEARAARKVRIHRRAVRARCRARLRLGARRAGRAGRLAWQLAAKAFDTLVWLSSGIVKMVPVLAAIVALREVPWQQWGTALWTALVARWGG